MTAPTKAQRARWAKILEFGCIIIFCKRKPSIHHCGTSMGCKKDHDKVLPLCYFHHQGKQGLHTLGRRAWERIFGTEEELMEKLKKMLIRADCGL